MPKEYIPGVEKGLELVLGSGVLAGFPVVDLKVTLIDGAYHDVDFSALAFEIASRAALKEALREGRPDPARADHEGRGLHAEDYTRLGHRRPQLAARPDPRRQDMSRAVTVINAMVPLANMFGYVNNLRSMSQRARHLHHAVRSFAPRNHCSPKMIHHLACDGNARLNALAQPNECPDAAAEWDYPAFTKTSPREDFGEDRELV